jgi:hypothetical protein
MAVPPEHRRADHLVPAAQAFVADVSAEQARLGDLTRQQLDAVTELQEIEQRLARVAAQAGAHQDGHPSVGPVTAEMLAVGVDVEGLAAELDAARAHERACEEAVEPEVMTGAAEAFLVARLDAHRRVSYAGSVPLVLDDALAPFDDAARARVLERLSREAGDVQIVYVTGGDPAVIAWADQAGFERAAVVRWPSAQP